MVGTPQMMRMVWLSCQITRVGADALNREAGRIYARVLVTPYRI